jgi:hypothetical protein
VALIAAITFAILFVVSLIHDRRKAKGDSVSAAR